MSKLTKELKENFSFYSISIFLLLALFNPLFKKYDYGAGWPLVIIFGVMLALWAAMEWKKKRERAGVELIFLLIFVAAVAASFALSQTKNLGLPEAVAFVSMPVFYLIFSHQRLNWGKKMLRFLMWMAVIAVGLGYFSYVAGGHPRMSGPFFNIFYHANVWPNAFAVFLLMIWPLFLLVKNRWVRVMGLGVLLSGLLLSFSRGAFLAMCGQIVLLGLFFWRSVDWKKMLSVLLVAALGMGLFVGMNKLRDLGGLVSLDVVEKVSFANNELVTSGVERKDFWLGAVELTAEKPWFGWGPFSFRQAYNPIQESLLAASDHPHNIFLKMSAENGLIAALSFLAFLSLLLIRVAQRWKNLSKERKLAVFVLGLGAAGALAHSMIDYNFNFMANWLIFFLLLVIGRSLLVREENLRWRGMPVVMPLSVIIAAICFYEGAFLVAEEMGENIGTTLYPRNMLLDAADSLIHEHQEVVALGALELQTELNPLDDRAWYLKGVIFCGGEHNHRHSFHNLEDCEDSFQEALRLNPMNNIAYYRDYFRVLENLGRESELVDEASAVLREYFAHVQMNTHFTAYTPNVEAAAELGEMLIPYLDQAEKAEMEVTIEEMLLKAEKLREAKSF